MILESSRRKVARAKEHIHDFERRFRRFADEKPCGEVIEPDPHIPEHQIHKLKVIKPIPSALEEISADAVNNLRAALDQSGYAVSVASGKINPEHIAFPFSGSSANFEKSAPGRCKDLPDEIFTFFRGLKPYKGGNDFLCALNDLCNADKHKFLTPVIGGMACVRAGVEATGFFSMPERPAWDRVNNEIEMFTIGPHTEKFEYEFDFTFFVAFDDIEIIRGKEAIGVLYALTGEVERILSALEAEASRLGIG